MGSSWIKPTAQGRVFLERNALQLDRALSRAQKRFSAVVGVFALALFAVIHFVLA